MVAAKGGARAGFDGAVASGETTRSRTLDGEGEEMFEAILVVVVIGIFTVEVIECRDKCR